jgi:hypothetical protein
MKAFAIDPQTQTIEEIDIEMKANTTYTFFKSILIDDLTTINNHVIHTDANALSEEKKAYFIGEQLILGTALIIGKNGMEEGDVSISEKDLKKLLRFNTSDFYAQALILLGKSDINLYKIFSVNQEGKEVNISTEWVLFAFDMADDRTKEYFINELKKTLENKEDVPAFIQKLGQLAINAAPQ